MTLTKYFYTTIFLSLILGCFSNIPSVLLLITIPLLFISKIWNKRNIIMFAIGISMCVGFGSYYTQSKINQIHNKLESDSNTLIGHFTENKGKLSFQIEYTLRQKWLPLNTQSQVINAPKEFTTDSTYLIHGKLYPIKPDLFNTKQMTYSNYSQNKAFRLYILDYQNLKSNQDLTQQLNQDLTFKINSNFNPLSSAYLNGILLGNKTLLTNRKAIQNIGISHLFAASGYHVGILYGIILLIFYFTPRFKYKKLVEFIVSLSLIWAYGSLLYFSPSILRANFLFTFIGGLRLLNKKFSMIELLSFIGILMVVNNPLVVYEISFQLSFFAVYSILLFFPIIQEKYSHLPKMIKYPLDIINVSFSAQILTLPISLYYFNQFPTYSLLSNIIITPIVSITIPLSVFTLFLNSIGIPNFYLSKAVDLLFGLINLLIEKINVLPNNIISNLFLNLTEVVLIIIFIIICYSFFVRLKRNPILKISLLCVLLMLFKLEKYFSNKNHSLQNEAYIIPQRDFCNFYYLEKQTLHAFEVYPSSYFINRIKQKHHLTNVIQSKIPCSNIELNINKTRVQSLKNKIVVWESNSLKFSSRDKIKKPKHLILN